MAAKAFEKYNGAPIDGGSTKLKLEMVVDPNRKPLIARIQPNQIAKTVAAAKKQQNGRNTNNNAKKAQTKQAPAKKAQAASKKAPKRGKKTVEELDQEMADYFETK
ncbi:hypothetical protein BABINDRAFT_162913 [Babjeviella inositovora NRRL Y-12698]|uniref:Chromatin target of PRMT1 protein C-terminal domain-containing protein n=1 Tax=Babjeviella inositovora NRRL Y-12698 TaxID=984486 RepID=A0A1E3QKW2_9ASCO|nr:uncharacterized protein BABINDRAFT_162913 [Babjeviella inositovora NRRL Y-12698]ODQ78258.1 hypothetical protein BABINDRAFT_162913 [Babjeviella inositovora NRRL Y-12698]